MFGKFCASALTIFALAPSAVFAAPTVRFTTLHVFHGTDGLVSGPGPLLKVSDRRWYGTVQGGGEHGHGALFSITPQGDFRLLYSFSGGLDGDQPNTLFKDPAGPIYGATVFGGLEPSQGVLFSLGEDGTPTVIYNFTGFEDGGQVGGSMVQFKQGSFYGTTGNDARGTVYRFTPPSSLETLHQFQFFDPDQTGPYFGLSEADGVFYGTTYADGPTPTYGTVFRVTDAGELTTLYTFTGGADGSRPIGPPVQAADGNFYGVASEGGEFGCGTIYRIDSSGIFTLVHAFTGDPAASDGGGCVPFAALAKGKDGRLYGSTYGGGEFGIGLIFRLSVASELEVLYTLENVNRLGGIQSPLVEGRDGTFFGMTGGGLRSTGTVFKLVVHEAE